MSTVLVIEDEGDLRAVLDYNLRKAGHTVVLAECGHKGLVLCRQHRPGIVLLDLMLPDLSGTEVCRALRDDPATRATPIIMLTAKTDEVDRVVGFELGADDYLTKPFSMRELLLRIQAILRRADSGPEPQQTVVFGRLRIDRAAHRVWVDDREVSLTALEFRLLVVLEERKNRLQSRDTLIDAVWSTDASVVVTTRTVDTHIKRLRDKLGPAGSYIRTVRGAGYRFAGSPNEAEE